MKQYIQLENRTPGQTHLKIEVYYDLGGMNYFSGTIKPRGIFLSVSPVEVGDRFETYKGFTGSYMLLKELKRKNDKALSELCTTTFAEIDKRLGKSWNLVEAVLAKNNIKLGGIK